MSLRQGLWPEAVVAALASLSVGWPLTTLLQEQTWVSAAVVAVALVAVVGAVLRSVNALPWVVAASQLLMGVLLLGWLFLGPTLWLGLPTPSSGVLATELFAEAGTVLQQFAAPAPTTTGVAFLVVSVLVLTAIAVDVIGVTNGAPGMAGIPLAAGFLVSVSNNGEAMEPWFFIATASLWLVMLGQQSGRLLAAWPTADRREFAGPARFTSGYRFLGRLMGALALVGALVVAAFVPHLPPTFLGQGLARSSDANDLAGAGNQVSFTETMDPSRDLRNRSTAPVLQYTSTARVLQPLRVSATSEYEGQTWQAPDRDGTTVDGPDLPAPLGRSAEALASTEEVKVSLNTLQPPHLAVPVGTTSVVLDAPTVEVSEESGAVLVEDPVPAYSAAYTELTAEPGLEPVGPSAAAVAADDPDLLQVPAESAPAVEDAATAVVGAQADPFTVGQLLQEHFRSAAYTYSLDLAPPRPEVSDDPISQFLANRQGYCVQFATAMVMMARSQDIPARMAVGFLSGEGQDDGSRVVVAADAHTWPELYIDGLGWTRFEPTPGVRSGAPPELTRSQDPAQAVPEEVPQTPQDQTQSEVDADDSSADSTWWQSWVTWMLRWRWALAAAVLLILATTVLPVAGRWYRQREARRAQTSREQIESQWLVLTRSLTDLGVPDPGPRSPRAMQAHYDAETRLEHEGRAALHRVSTTLELSRYAPSDSIGSETGHRVGTDVATVVDAARASAPWAVRARAALAPPSGRAGVAAWLRSVTGRGEES